MQSSSLKLLSPEIETVPVFDTDRQHRNLTALRVDLIEYPKAVVRPETKLPIRSECDRPFQWLSVSGFHVRLVDQLGFNRRLNDGMMFGFDGPQMFLRLIRIDHSERRLPDHD